MSTNDLFHFRDIEPKLGPLIEKLQEEQDRTKSAIFREALKDIIKKYLGEEAIEDYHYFKKRRKRR